LPIAAQMSAYDPKRTFLRTPRCRLCQILIGLDQGPPTAADQSDFVGVKKLTKVSH
jgi:hypothetical protein